jgi:hypothetical protein
MALMASAYAAGAAVKAFMASAYAGGTAVRVFTASAYAAGAAERAAMEHRQGFGSCEDSRQPPKRLLELVDLVDPLENASHRWM